jgi:4-cresol dehydrogenase (hydroxylating)
VGPADAFAAWERALGPGSVAYDDATLARLARTTLAAASRPLGVVRPRTRDDVVSAVRIAAAHRVPLYPVSRGRNWGLGSSCPVTEGQVVLDLSRLNRIIAVDPELAYAVVEPGVSQGQLAQHLDDQGFGVSLDVTAAGPDTSVLGNCIDRGDGFGPLSDHFANCCGLEVVLADGSVLETGPGRYPGARTAFTHNAGAGPALQGLFSQSGMGVVTRLAVWLYPLPSCVTGFAISLPHDGDLSALVDRLRPLRLDGTLPQSVHVYDRARLTIGAGRPPGAWLAIGGLYGSRDRVRVDRRALKYAVGSLARCRFFDTRRISRGLQVARRLERLGASAGATLRATLRGVLSALGLLCGVPNDSALRLTRTRAGDARNPRSLDPLDSGIGMYWGALLSPLRGADCARLVELVRGEHARHGFTPHLTCSLLSGRTALVATTLYYDRDNREEAERAARSHASCLERAIAEGYPPARVGVTDMGMLDPDGGSFWRVARTIKEALDPHGIIAPGRYAPWEAP